MEKIEETLTMVSSQLWEISVLLVFMTSVIAAPTPEVKQELCNLLPSTLEKAKQEREEKNK